ncbi:MAG: tRNA (N(6)-L-threonylcarbamoyladenosine(37)-C(2))-methylthiotransferase MtaB [Lentisphaerae bacterium]|nr:tRNA (N(6)-L-threonylcarbamoyladenosine(37)-C(2))-methylthiotransferase MtaB [Lentisphaerota bacterium]MCP4103538.1 tRNA (N(6)-L-threonylcarbamoyladenosine(37)-C(2))-methylthiotransferase MtaB [Lentisphaerota bacterium]
MTSAGNAAVFTIGCRLNQADAALICTRLEEQGWSIVRPEYEGRVDLLVVNTCTVTGAAARKSRQAVRKFRRNHPECCIVVTGCSVEIENSDWAKEDAADLILTNPEKKDIADLIIKYLEHKSVSTGHTFSLNQPVKVFQEKAAGHFPFKSRAFLKVQEGCNNFCSYCIVPYARGPERSRDWDEVISDFKQFINAGFEEVVLTGVNICAYNDNGRALTDLLRELCKIDGKFRIRLSSTEPHPNNMELLEVMRNNQKICRFLHLSLQHGTDEILKSMNRKYTTAEFADFIYAARQAMPGIHLGTDIIVGYPGETEELFQKELDFVKEMAFANIHIFTFSPREGTPAANMSGRVNGKVCEARRARLSVLAADLKRDFIISQLDKELAVIFERKGEDGRFYGWSDNYINVICDSSEIVKNSIVKVITQEALPDGSLVGNLA